MFGDRIKEIRKSLDLSQVEFGERLGVSGGAISLLEKDERNLTEQMKTAICNTFKVRRIWLDEGIEPIFEKADHSIINAVDSLLLEGNTTAKKLLSVIQKMNPQQWKAMAEILAMLVEEETGE